MTINDPRDSPEYQVGGNKYKGQFEEISSGVPASVVNDFHKKSDVDAGQQAQHHTLGQRHDQSAPGDHKHNGVDSSLILKGTTLTGSRGGNAAVLSIVNALKKLGATDTTTP